VPEEIQRGVEERDIKAIGGSNLAQGVDKPGVRETVGLGQAYADQLRLFGHEGKSSSLFLAASRYTFLFGRQSIAQKRGKSKIEWISFFLQGCP
jgi:hypothetical protein